MGIHFVPVLLFCIFDCLTEVVACVFVHVHVRHLMLRYSRSGEQKELSSCTLPQSRQELLIMKQFPTAFLFPPEFFLPIGTMDGEAHWLNGRGQYISRENHDSVKQSMLQSRIFLWKGILALNSSTLLSTDYTLASNILVSGGLYARCLILNRAPILLHLLWWSNSFQPISIGLRSGDCGGQLN